MNKFIGIGRLTTDPEVRVAQNGSGTMVARYRLAIDRAFKRDNEQTADFLPCVAFGKQAEFAEKYMRKGGKFAVIGRIQTGSYTNREGQKVYTTDVIVESQEFCESKAESSAERIELPVDDIPRPDSDGFMEIPENIDEGLPFR